MSIDLVLAGLLIPLRRHVEENPYVVLDQVVRLASVIYPPLPSIDDEVADRMHGPGVVRNPRWKRDASDLAVHGKISGHEMCKAARIGGCDIGRPKCRRGIRLDVEEVFVFQVSGEALGIAPDGTHVDVDFKPLQVAAVVGRRYSGEDLKTAVVGAGYLGGAPANLALRSINGENLSGGSRDFHGSACAGARRIAYISARGENGRRKKEQEDTNGFLSSKHVFGGCTFLSGWMRVGEP